MGIDYSTALALRAGIYSELEDYEKAILYKEESLMIKKNLYGNDHVEVLTGYKTLLTLKKAKYDKNNKWIFINLYFVYQSFRFLC